MTIALVALVGIALLLTLLVRMLEPRLAFFPAPGETTTPQQFGIPYEPLTIETADGERLRAWRITTTTARAQIVYFHGNGGNLSVWAPILAGIARRGYGVLAVDYRGYGVSTGHPTERGLYRDVDAVVNVVAASRNSPAPLIYWGRSLGTTMAAYAGTQHQPDALILEAGFPDARSLIRSSPPLAFLSVFSTYRFPTAKFLQQVHVPVLVMHGDHDQVVPFELGRALFAQVTGPKRFVTIAGADHNDATPPDAHAYWTAIDDFIATLRQR